MPIDRFDGKLIIKRRDEIRDEWLRDFKNRIPSADTSKNSQAFIDASTDADLLVPVYSNAGVLADATGFYTARGKLLDAYAEKIRRPRRGAVGARGYIIIEAATGGAEILAGTEIRYTAKNVRFMVETTGLYLPGSLCAIVGISTGAQTNLAKDTVLTWLSPPVGVLGTAKVFENTDGSGLTGGAPEETDDELVAALIERHANPPSSGNDAAIIQATEELQGIAIQKAFVFPCLGGPGQYALAFTMRPDRPGASRLPNGAHLAFVEAKIKDAFPADDGLTMLQLADHEYAVQLRVRFRTGASGFVDTVPWPAYGATPVTVLSGGGNPAATALFCRVGDVVTAPSVGNTVAFYDSVSRVFKQKRISAVAAVVGHPDQFDLTFDITANVSDLTLVPANGALVSPYAPEMSVVIDPILAYADKQGPGEMVSTFYDAGRRQRRIPEAAPESWPSTVSNAILDDIFKLLADATLVSPTTPYATTVGAGPLCYLHRLTDIAVYSQ